MDITPQTITLDNTDSIAVFTEGGRVFYDLDALVMQYTQAVVARTAHGAEHGCLDDASRNYLLGQLEMLDSIAASTDTLSLEYTFSRESANKE